MTYDDGIVAIYDVVNMAQAGDVPVRKLSLAGRLYFTEETVGVTRYYEAIKAEQLIEKVIGVQPEMAININQIAILEDGNQYAIRMVQRADDDNGLKYLRLSLERNGEEYEIARNDSQSN